MASIDHNKLICFYSDEEGEDDDALLFLPVAPEIEESEEGWVGDQVRDLVVLNFNL